MHIVLNSRVSSAVRMTLLWQIETVGIVLTVIGAMPNNVEALLGGIVSQFIEKTFLALA